MPKVMIQSILSSTDHGHALSQRTGCRSCSIGSLPIGRIRTASNATRKLTWLAAYPCPEVSNFPIAMQGQLSASERVDARPWFQAPTALPWNPSGAMHLQIPNKTMHIRTYIARFHPRFLYSSVKSMIAMKSRIDPAAPVESFNRFQKFPNNGTKSQSHQHIHEEINKQVKDIELALPSQLLGEWRRSRSAHLHQIGLRPTGCLSPHATVVLCMLACMVRIICCHPNTGQVFHFAMPNSHSFAFCTLGPLGCTRPRIYYYFYTPRLHSCVTTCSLCLTYELNFFKLKQWSILQYYDLEELDTKHEQGPRLTGLRARQKGASIFPRIQAHACQTLRMIYSWHSLIVVSIFISRMIGIFPPLHQGVSCRKRSECGAAPSVGLRSRKGSNGQHEIGAWHNWAF